MKWIATYCLTDINYGATLDWYRHNNAKTLRNQSTDKKQNSGFYAVIGYQDIIAGCKRWYDEVVAGPFLSKEEALTAGAEYLEVWGKEYEVNPTPPYN